MFLSCIVAYMLGWKTWDAVRCSPVGGESDARRRIQVHPAPAPPRPLPLVSIACVLCSVAHTQTQNGAEGTWLGKAPEFHNMSRLDFTIVRLIQWEEQDTSTESRKWSD